MKIHPLTIAVVGCGYITQSEHVPAILSLLPQIRVAATVDPDPARAASVGEVFGAPSFTSLAAALAGTRFDAVLIATPAPTHAALVAEAAAAGLHILMEKPIAYSLAEGLAAIDAVKNSGVHCMVAYHRRFDDDCLKVKDMLAEGALGEVRAAVSLGRLALPSFYRGYAPVVPPKHATVRQDVPSDWLAENSIHHLNLMRFWLGDITAIHNATYRADDHNLGIVTLSFGDVLASHHQLRGMECGEEISLYGSDASLHVGLWYPHRPYAFPKLTLFSAKTGTRTELIQPRTNPYANELRHFAALVAGEADNPSTLEDAQRDLEHLVSILGAVTYTHNKSGE